MQRINSKEVRAYLDSAKNGDSRWFFDDTGNSLRLVKTGSRWASNFRRAPGWPLVSEEYEGMICDSDVCEHLEIMDYMLVGGTCQ